MSDRYLFRAKFLEESGLDGFAIGYLAGIGCIADLQLRRDVEIDSATLGQSIGN